MAAKLPYMASPGLVPKILGKIQEARRPDRFTQDFLETKLGHSGGNARAMIPLLKRLGFVASDGTPTRRYDQFRNVDTQAQAMNEGLRGAYSELFDRNEYAYEISKEKLTGLVTEITGASRDDSTTRFTVSTFLALKEFADFEFPVTADEASRQDDNASMIGVSPDVAAPTTSKGGGVNSADDVSLALSYTINLNLPETTDPEVFNAIFRALKENLLSRS